MNRTTELDIDGRDEEPTRPSRDQEKQQPDPGYFRRQKHPAEAIQQVGCRCVTPRPAPRASTAD